MKIYSKIENGQLSDNAELSFLAELASHEGKDICITVDRKRLKISNEMHAYYREVVLPVVAQHYLDRGYKVTQAQVHKELKQLFGPDEDVGILEPVFKKKASMADYTKPESVQFIDDIKQAFASEGVYIQDPNEHLLPPKESYYVPN